MRCLAVVGCFALATMLAGCGTGRGAASGPTPAVSTGGARASSGTPAAGGSAGVGGATPTPSAAGGFVLTEGVEHNVCGIRLVLKFIPPSANSGTTDQAFLVGGPIADGHGVLPAPTADQPLPSNIAPARPGMTVTVLGRRFRIDSVDVANRRVRVEALC
jgi:hypothetical protein